MFWKSDPADTSDFQEWILLILGAYPILSGVENAGT